MTHFKVLLALPVIAIFVTAGCLGHPPAPKVQPLESDLESPPLGKDVDNLLRGWVTGPDLGPIEGASVALLDARLSALTDREGAYRFENLEPRDHLVTASKEGYRTKTQRALTSNGTIFELNFTLEEIPVDRPYHEIRDFKGLIACHVAYGTTAQEPSRQDCGAVDSNDQPSKEFLLPGGLAQVQIEAFWTPKTPAAGNLALEVDTVGLGHQDTSVGGAEGPSGMKVTLPKSLLAKYYGDGGQLRVTMGPTASLAGDEAALDAGVAFQQDFTLYLTLFFVEPGDPDFTAQPE